MITVIVHVFKFVHVSVFNLRHLLFFLQTSTSIVVPYARHRFCRIERIIDKGYTLRGEFKNNGPEFLATPCTSDVPHRGWSLQVEGIKNTGAEAISIPKPCRQSQTCYFLVRSALISDRPGTSRTGLVSAGF